MSEPEFYLSLLSSRCRGVSRLSEEQSDTSNPFRKDPDRLLDVLLDHALAAICVSNERGDVFCVSLAMDSNGAKLYVSTNGPVPANVTVHHLEKKIRSSN